jgi:hypothetical protein
VSDSLLKGAERERNLARDVYFSEHYFSMPQLCSFAHQLNHIWRLKPQSVLEIGPGNGFVSMFLRRSGIPVTTVDINPALEPDICAPLSELSKHVHQNFDLVVCCEVLEHMPLSELDDNLNYLRAAGNRLYLTLPDSKRSVGLGGLLKLPKGLTIEIDMNVALPIKRPLEGGPHFWEVGYSADCTRKEIVTRLKKRFGVVRSGRYPLNPYHIYFECQ